MVPGEADDLLSQYEAGLSEIAEHADDDSLTPRDTLDDVFGSDDEEVEFDGPDYDPDEAVEE
jgi:hypothetical protein